MLPVVNPGMVPVLATIRIAALATNREVIVHAPTKGAATELHWLEMLNEYLPKRYCADSAFMVDCEGKISQQIDVVIYDRQYSPFLFSQDGAKFIPAESVYAVFEVRQELNAKNLSYAAEKAASVRVLRRTSAPIPHAGGKFEPKEPCPILAGILTLDCEWSPPIDEAIGKTLSNVEQHGRIDLGCALRAGSFEVLYGSDSKTAIQVSSADSSLIFFFLKLLSRLQSAGTVSAVDFAEYSKVL